MTITNNSQMLGELEDVNWIRQSMFLPKRINIGNGSVANFTNKLNFSYGSLSFEDTSLGGNRSINPLPQFTRHADITLPSLLTRNVSTGSPSPIESMGMGRCYNEIFNQNASRIYLQFGIPVYNSLGNFLTTFYDPAYGNMTNSGVIGGSDLLYTIGKFVGFISIWAVVPELALINFLYSTGKKFVADLLKIPLSKFYYVKPTMFLYWSSVTTIVNALMVNMKMAQGVLPGDLTRDENKQPEFREEKKLQEYQAEMKILNKIMPDIFLDTVGGINIRRVATRYQRLEDAHYRAIRQIRDSGIDELSVISRLQNYYNNPTQHWDLKNPMGEKEYAESYIASSSGQGKYLIDNLIVDFFTGDDGKVTTASRDGEKVSAEKSTQIGVFDAIKHDITQLWNGINQHLVDYYNFASAEARNGGAFVSFIVDYDPRIQTSFNNNTRESDLANTMNETSRNIRNKLHDLSDGNLGDNMLADTLEGIISTAKSFLSGVANSMGLSGLAILGGKTFVDVPEYWDSSTTAMPTSSYNIKLRTPYGNPISVLNNIMVPLAMLIAGVAPRTTGKNSYAGPFLCKLWQRGYNQIQIGIIKDLNISIATSNIGRNLMYQPTGIDVSFSIANLSKILHVPIINELSDRDAFGITLFDEDNNFTEYMAILSGLSLADQYYPSNRWRLRAIKSQLNFRSFVSAENLLMWFNDNTAPGQIISIVIGRNKELI